MNPFVLSFIALCVAQGAVAQYGQGYQQRKMSPSPQTYGQQSSYGMQQQQQQQSYSAAPASYESPSSAQMATYEERTPAAASSYGKQQQSYSRPQQQQQSGYGQQQQSSYGQQQQQQTYAAAKPAAKYEEPSHPPQPFSWGYDISDGYGSAQYHKESGDEYGKRVGSYGYTDAYGIYRQVDYVADEHGFRATVKSNEPGLQKGAESPASTEFLVYDPPSNYYASNSYNQASSGASSYGSGKQSAYPAAPAQTYAPVAQSYPAPAQQQTYGPQRPSSYKQPAAMSSYGQQQQYAAASSSAPTYQKTSKAY